ncbi:MAG TPA: class I SAM-dependent methyltransferase [Anaerolineae bacterium]|nr:class I SAM-dependent methyltransferase [Anaerolineae bacterium]
METMIRGPSPEFHGPRHLFRVSMMADCLAQALPPLSKRVLDAGSGNGSLVVALARRGYRVEGVDLSPACVAYSRGLIQRLGLAGRAAVRVGDVARLPYPDESFDGLTSGEVLEHVPDDRRAVREFHRVLRPGGVCVVTVPLGKDLGPLDRWAGHRRRYDQEGLRELFEEAGFRVELLRPWGFPFMALYQRLVHEPLLMRRATRSEGDALLSLAPRLGQNPLLACLARALFRVDGLFAGLPWGVGLLLRVRKG